MKKTPWTALILVSVGLLGGWAILAGAMRTAEESVRDHLVSRFGDRIAFESLEAGPGSLRLEDVEVAHEERGIQMDVPRLEARFGIKKLIARDPSPESVHLKKPNLRVDLDALLGSGGKASESSTDSPPQGSLPDPLSGRSGELVLEEARILLTSRNASVPSGKGFGKDPNGTRNLEGQSPGGD